MPKRFDPTKTRRYADDEARRMEAYQDWIAGMGFPQIAEKYGYIDRQAARKAVLTVKRAFLEDAAEARDQATERIMGPLMAMRQEALQGDPAAANAYRGLEERLSKLHGLDAPVRTDVTSDGDKIRIEVVRDWDAPTE